ncbi:hypothetical protein CEXT_294191 [Caerostris extrusa]|uniref:Uncharacterized protein n=1 Tax=Caerostris extrusa TaxID=172846 RepID=A0AAV4S3E7_CAEEX|nr:hypothetical protein CEXT_294191 [Caerostris extrusa]
MHRSARIRRRRLNGLLTSNPPFSDRRGGELSVFSIDRLVTQAEWCVPVEGSDYGCVFCGGYKTAAENNEKPTTRLQMIPTIRPKAGFQGNEISSSGEITRRGPPRSSANSAGEIRGPSVLPWKNTLWTS